MSDGVNGNSRLKWKFFNYNNLNQLSFLINIIFFIFGISIIKGRPRNIINFSSEIKLIIIGKGNQSLLNNEFNPKPSQVFVNGIYRSSCIISCELENEENRVTLIFERIK